MHSWKARVVVITGASAGVGRAIARRFARAGASLGLIARGRERLDETVREVEALGGRAHAMALDVADADEVDAAADTFERVLGPIDVWINNAMTSVFAELCDVTPDEYRRVTDVVYHGAVHGTMSALRRMLPRDRGRVLFVGSALAYRGIPLQSAYCGAKHAIQGMFESLRAELLHRSSGVTTGIVQLPAMNTPQFEWCRSKMPHRAQPVPPIFQPEVAARAVEAMARRRRAELYVSFSTMRAIIGNKLAPRIADRYLGRVGYSSQQTEEPQLPAPDNLFAPVPGEFAAHGRFDRRASPRSPMTWLALHRGTIAALSLALLGSGVLAWRTRHR
jgi:NAD(P)-dependent dehydrogenase (short-subunit alcohol dehydrogenase family)